MSIFEGLKAIPAYYAKFNDHKIPFIVSVTFVDDKNQIQLPPAVEQSIDKTIDITGSEGLVTVKVTTIEKISQAREFFEKCTAIPKSILFFHCWSDEIAEQLMAHISDLFEISMISVQDAVDVITPTQPV